MPFLTAVMDEDKQRDSVNEIMAEYFELRPIERFKPTGKVNSKFDEILLVEVDDQLVSFVLIIPQSFRQFNTSYPLYETVSHLTSAQHSS